MGGTLVKVDLGHGRGWASPAAAASIRRIDAQLGRPADINEAGRSPEQADKNHRAWLDYLAGGPWAPYALPASLSVHCRGDAADSDDWYDPAAAAVWRDNGWRQTARYPGTKKDEPWHGEHFPELDNHRNDPAGGATITPRRKVMSSIPPLVTSNGRDIWTLNDEGKKRPVKPTEMDVYREIAQKLGEDINKYIATGVKTSAIPSA